MKYYSLIELIKAYNENKELIDAYTRGDTVEGYGSGGTILGMTVGVFLFIIFIHIFMWFYILIALIRRHGEMGTGLIILSIVSLIFPFPLILFITFLILFFGGRKQSKKSSKK